MSRRFNKQSQPGLSQHTLANRLQTGLLLAFLAAYPALLGWLLWGGDVVVWLALFGLLFAFFSPVNSPQWVMRLARAKPLPVSQAPRLHQIVAELSTRARLEAVPQLYYLSSRQLNAFAVGRSQHSAIAVSAGLTKILDRDEVEAVVAHEISHLANDDIRVMSLAALSGRMTGFFSLVGLLMLLFSLPLILFSGMHINWLALALLIFAPQLSTLAQLGLSRVREYQADLTAAQLLGSPQALITALTRIEHYSKPLWQRLLPGYSLPGFLRTHPPTAERVRRLQGLRRARGGAASQAEIRLSRTDYRWGRFTEAPIHQWGRSRQGVAGQSRSLRMKRLRPSSLA